MLTTQPVDRERRLALLLADGTGDYDFVRAVAIGDMVYLEGHVKSLPHKQRAEELAEYVGFREVQNALRIFPEGEAGREGTPSPHPAR
jgi:hypothetical protein